MQTETAPLHNLLGKVPIEPGGKVGLDACGRCMGEKSFQSTLLGVAGNQEVYSSENMSLLESLKTVSSEDGLSLKGIIDFLKQNNISIPGEKGQLDNIIKSLIVGLDDSENNDIPGNSEQKLEGDLFNNAEGNAKQEAELLRLLSLVTGCGTDTDNAEKSAKPNSLLNETGFFKDLKLPSELALKEGHVGSNNPGSEILKNSALQNILQSDGPLSDEKSQKGIPLEKGNTVINPESSKNTREDCSQKSVAETQKDFSLFKQSRIETSLQEQFVQAKTSFVKETTGNDSTQAKVIQMNTPIEKQEINNDLIQEKVFQADRTTAQAKVIQMNTPIEKQEINNGLIQEKVVQADGTTAQKIVNKEPSLTAMSGFKESAEGEQNPEKDLLKNMDVFNKENSDRAAINKGRNPIEQTVADSKPSSDAEAKISSMYSNPNVEKSAEENSNSAQEKTSTKLENNSEIKVSEKTTDDNLKNPILLKSYKSNSETTGKDLNVLNKEVNHSQDGKTSDSEKGENSRFNITPNKEMPTISTNADSWQRYLNIKDPAQKTQMSGEHVNVGKVVKIESGSGEEATFSSNHQSTEKNPESVPQTKETQHFQKTFQPAVMKQVVEKAMLNLKNGQSSIRISLKPETLGHLKMQITTENNQVMVKILTEVPMVKDIIESNLSQLKADFQNQGLEIEKFDVSVDHGSKQNKAFSGHLPSHGAKGGSGDDGNEDGLLKDIEEKGMHADTRKSSGLVNFFA